MVLKSSPFFFPYSMVICRNVIIFGSCKFQDKGCTFDHTVETNESVSVTTEKLSETTTATAKLDINTPAFEPAASTILTSPPKKSFTIDTSNSLNVAAKPYNPTSFEPLVDQSAYEHHVYEAQSQQQHQPVQ